MRPARRLAYRRMDRDLAELPDPQPGERLDARFATAVAAQGRRWAALLRSAGRLGDALAWAAVAAVAALLVAGLLLAGRPLLQARPAADPTTTPRPTPTRRLQPTIPAGAGVAYDGITFDFGPSIAAGVRPETVRAMDDAVGLLHPEHVRFNFREYAHSGNQEPHIAIYPVAEYAAVQEYAAGMIERLRQFLSDRPAAPRSIPFLPYMNAGQAMCTNISYLDFQNGHGVRFLTEYHQACVPINNQDLFYTFQGLTDDGAWYISAILPVAHPSLPADHSIIFTSEWTHCEGYEDYIRGIVVQLDAEPDESFTPQLDLLDEMIRSLRVR
jgi:hypothetical protein